MLRFEVVDVSAPRPLGGRAVPATVAGDVHPVARGEVAVPA